MHLCSTYFTPGKRVCCVISSDISSPPSPKCRIGADSSAYFFLRYSSISSSFWELKNVHISKQKKITHPLQRELTNPTSFSRLVTNTHSNTDATSGAARMCVADLYALKKDQSLPQKIKQAMFYFVIPSQRITSPSGTLWEYCSDECTTFWMNWQSTSASSQWATATNLNVFLMHATRLYTRVHNESLQTHKHMHICAHIHTQARKHKHTHYTYYCCRCWIQVSIM